MEKKVSSFNVSSSYSNEESVVIESDSSDIPSVVVSFSFFAASFAFLLQQIVTIIKNGKIIYFYFDTLKNNYKINILIV